MEQIAKRTAEPMEVFEIVPLGEALDIIMQGAAKKRHKADWLWLTGRMKLVDRLEPKERELDGVLALMRLGQKMSRGIGASREEVDQIGGADGATQWRDIIAPVEIPFQRRAMPDTENKIRVRERFFEQRTESGGIGRKADPEINVGRDDANQGGLLRRRRQLRGRK